jgi:hypothetical protein
VRGDIRLSELHGVLQSVMGWTGSHLYKFEIDGIDYGPAGQFAWGMRNDTKTRLDRVADAGTTFVYHYDFGDGWEHEIDVEAILSTELSGSHVVCLAGEHSCPPEDCGGQPGYERFLRALKRASGAESEALLRQVGGTFDPAAFDLDETNRRLRLR